MHFVGDAPLAAKHWKADTFYGAQFLNGCNPDTIKRCTELPPKFPVTQKMVGNLLDAGDTLQKAIKVRTIQKVFLVYQFGYSKAVLLELTFIYRVECKNYLRGII